MTYQSEYQRNYQNRSPKKFHELSVEERKLGEVPKRSSSSPWRRRRALPMSPNRTYKDDNDVVVIGPNEKFSSSVHYRLRQPVKQQTYVPKSHEYVVLGRNEKFEDNVIYKLRNPVVTNSPRIVIRKRPIESHSCGIQSNINNTTSNSYNPQYRQKHHSNQKRHVASSEYRQSYTWKHSQNDLANKEKYVDNAELRARRLELMQPPVHVSHAEKISVGVNTSTRVENCTQPNEQHLKRKVVDSTKPFCLKNDKTNGGRKKGRRHRHSKQHKSFEAEEVQDRKPKECVEIDHAHTDDEDLGRNIDLAHEFREKYPYGKLRRWQSEYQSTFKPFWRYDYKNGKWYKDTSAEQTGFNTNLFWVKELMSTRKNADEYRANAEKDHLNRDFILPTGLDANNNYRGSYMNADESDTNSVISIDRDLERERIEGERRRERDGKRKPAQPVYLKKPKKPVQSATLKTDQTSQTDHPVDRIIYIDEVPPREPGVATKAFVRNLSSSSIQQNMAWETDSMQTQETDPDICLDRKKYTNYRLSKKNEMTHKRLPKQQESRGTHIYSPLPKAPEDNDYVLPVACEQTTQNNESNRFTNYSVASNQESHNATGRCSYDTHIPDRRPHTSINEYCTYPASRFKDEVTEYYYGRDDFRQPDPYVPASKPAFHNHLRTPIDDIGQIYNRRPKDDDVLSVNSARSLTSSCSLASQTLERAQNNMNRYWGNPSSKSNISPKKPFRGEN